MLGYLQMWHFPHKWGTKANLIYWKEHCSQHKSWDQSAWMLALSSEWYYAEVSDICLIPSI